MRPLDDSKMRIDCLDHAWAGTRVDLLEVNDVLDLIQRKAECFPRLNEAYDLKIGGGEGPVPRRRTFQFRDQPL